MVCECGGGWMMEERIEGEMIARHVFCKTTSLRSTLNLCGRSKLRCSRKSAIGLARLLCTEANTDYVE
jgi:hypothetical protein